MKEERARTLATRAFDADEVILGAAEELEQGWRFRLVAEDHPDVFGAVVDKHTGRVLKLTRGSPFDRDPTLYDRGYHSAMYDLVVTSTDDLEAAVRAIMSLQLSYREPYYRDGRVWRHDRPLTEDVVRERLSELPGIFTTGDGIIDVVESGDGALPFEFTLAEYWPQ